MSTGINLLFSESVVVLDKIREVVMFWEKAIGQQLENH